MISGGAYCSQMAMSSGMIKDSYGGIAFYFTSVHACRGVLSVKTVSFTVMHGLPLEVNHEEPGLSATVATSTSDFFERLRQRSGEVVIQNNAVQDWRVKTCTVNLKRAQ